MRVRPVDIHTPGRRSVSEIESVLARCTKHDDPTAGGDPRRLSLSRLTSPMPGFRTACWVASDFGEIVAVAGLELPQGDRADQPARLYLSVLPDMRHRGAGKSLLREAVRLLWAAGRRTVGGALPSGDTGARFAQAMGIPVAGRQIELSTDLAARPFRPLAETAGSTGPRRSPAPADVSVAVYPTLPGELRAALAVLGPIRDPAEEQVLAEWGYGVVRVVASAAGDVVGYVETLVPDGRYAHAHHRWTAVAPQWRRRLLGTRMHSELFEWLRANRHGVSRVRARLPAEARPLYAMLSRHGYQTAGNWQYYEAGVETLAGRLGLLR